MKKPTRIIVVIVFALAAAGWWFTHRHSGSSGEGSGEAEDQTDHQSVVQVQVAKITRKSLTEKFVTYGNVIAQPGKTHSVSVGFEAQVRHILVAPGQVVEAGEALVEIEPSSAAQLQLQQARNAAEAAQKELQQTQDRFNLKLATNQDLGAAQKAARDAELQLASFQKLGLGADRRVAADKAGVIAKVNTQPGQIVPVGGSLVEIIAEDEIEVKLGVEAEELPLLQNGQSIALFPVNNPAFGAVEGTIRLVTRQVNPETRLIDVYVSLPAGTRLLLGGYIRGEITRSAEGLVVPRAALLPEEDGFKLFTITENHAVKHTVKVGLENNREVELQATDLHAGETVVTRGNYELEDGMSVAGPAAP